MQDETFDPAVPRWIREWRWTAKNTAACLLPLLSVLQGMGS